MAISTAQMQLARWGAAAIREAFEQYLRDFRQITSRARDRFEKRDWRGHQRDARQRLGLVSECVWQTYLRVRTQLGETFSDKVTWAEMKAQYSEGLRDHPSPELAETFFNSVTRRIFSTTGVDPATEYVAPSCAPAPSSEPPFRRYERTGTTEALVTEILQDYRFHTPFRDLDGDARAAAARIDAHFDTSGDSKPIETVELADPVFYRGKAAYLVGRAWRSDQATPFIFALLNEEDGVSVDAMLLTDKDARILFSFTRSYFHVDVTSPCELVDFLRSILPMRRKSELYISIGYNKHGKTELYRELLHHLATTTDRFEPAAGDRGMVMAVFTLPTLDLIFKVIRDKFPPPKSTSKDEVMNKYALVFRQDRAGRLVDAQDFQFLAFDKARFSEPVLQELLTECGETVRVEGDHVVIKHLYVERRLRPLNLFVREADPASARAAVLDYGQSIKDLAATNTFPGDLLLKNFGVTRNGRVIFYDYDEMSLVTECNFRDLPTARDDYEETSSEAWFFVDSHDIFPEEFIRFLGLTPELERALRQEHGEILTAAFWRKIQERVKTGEIVDIFPYGPTQRLRTPSPSGRGPG